MKKGFTLMEILISIAVLSVIGVLIMVIFSRSLRGGNKVQIILAIKQNGQAILESIDKAVRSSDQVVCVNSTKNTLVIVKNGTYTRYRFVVPVSAANGQILQDNPVPVAGIEQNNITLFINRVCGTTDPMMPDAVIITDTNKTTGVSVLNGSFSRDRLAGFKDVITIKFDVTQGIGVLSSQSVSIDPVHFETTIQLR